MLDKIKDFQKIAKENGRDANSIAEFKSYITAVDNLPPGVSVSDIPGSTDYDAFYDKFVEGREDELVAEFIEEEPDWVDDVIGNTDLFLNFMLKKAQEVTDTEEDAKYQRDKWLDDNLHEWITKFIEMREYKDFVYNYIRDAKDYENWEAKKVEDAFYGE